ncbi:hypothetical protein OQZ55_11665 [Bacillus subtilis]|uniref:hypothetical protein n=1 Tax=Bacillus subtilis TaxID=1423 RepID=UPI001E2C4102|nr:hypothetical protein [Bacillus subtilis]MCT6513274.1 hypothetical protein [Bacillus subtilis]MCX4076853.1 hypothetical protein [Bacillus subtilis]MEC0434442.1 hypothetical protein [Bacillus subtilis]WRU03879.1 hypothetical protein VDS58_11500 [Bacillus subtilis]
MKRKIFATSLLALTMVSASFTGASAATLNESKVSEDAPFSIKRTTIYNSVPSWYQGSASAKIDGVYDETKFLLTNYSSKSVNYKITKGSTDMKSGTIAGNDSVTFNLKKHCLIVVITLLNYILTILLTEVLVLRQLVCKLFKASIWAFFFAKYVFIKILTPLYKRDILISFTNTSHISNILHARLELYHNQNLGGNSYEKVLQRIDCFCLISNHSGSPCFHITSLSSYAC